MEAADKMKERFLHNITYEIRIPLNTVVGFLNYYLQKMT